MREQQHKNLETTADTINATEAAPETCNSSRSGDAECPTQSEQESYQVLLLDHANCAIDENTESDHDSRENQQEISPEEEAPERHEDGEPQADINEFLQRDNDEPIGSHEGSESEEDFDDTDNLPNEQLYEWDPPERIEDFEAAPPEASNQYEPPSRVPTPKPEPFEVGAFKTRYYFYKYLQRTMEPVCFRQGQDYKEFFEKYWWLKNVFGDNIELRNRKWNEPDGAGLDNWATFFKRKWVTAGVIFGGFSWEEIFTGAYNVRQAAMHRTPLEKTHLYAALKLPGLLGDEKRAAEVYQVYKVVTDDPSVDADMREQAQKLLYPEGTTSSPRRLEDIISARSWYREK
ncbi:hypothetical protein OEA41_007299 [Lepraria neglecta]|uniref:Uncharacterized protein n=1 Tax=Lepraria neglecta TaxID=209136 RepID=A0AAE0DN47_9LECA|nr:hypothetical protein OEA41_007299 [Lepraria neglecta]